MRRRADFVFVLASTKSCLFLPVFACFFVLSRPRPCPSLSLFFSQNYNFFFSFLLFFFLLLLFSFFLPVLGVGISNNWLCVKQGTSTKINTERCRRCLYCKKTFTGSRSPPWPRHPAAKLLCPLGRHEMEALPLHPHLTI